MQIEISKYEGVARTLAAVTLATNSYSLLDRIANAVSGDVVDRAIYESMRILNALKQGEDTSIIEVEEKGERYIVVNRKKKEEPCKIKGYLADSGQFRNFIDDVSTNVRIARTVAAYAMSIVALNKGVE